MTLVEFIRAELTRLHGLLERGTADLSPEQWHAVPGGSSGKANTIAFELWHYARTEDNIVRFILQGRPTVWMEGGWAARLGLPERAQGTGMATAEAQALRIADLDGFRRYLREVWASTDDYLAHPDEATFSQPKLVKPLGEMPAIRALGQVCMTHGFTHLGELELARTLIGVGPAIGI
ncbi:MAG TPA: DinB family protein [Dehalococcoidia bacterium]|nr:DinB family protein [Dehalococcoidia bacterium]